MKLIKTLQIRFAPSKETYKSITELMCVKPTEEGVDNLDDHPPCDWRYEVVENEDDPNFDFINIFCDMLENKYEKLAELGIPKDDILFWYIYEYDQQCNMEFEPAEMKRLGDNGISLCVSCWESDEESEYEMDETETCCFCGESMNAENSVPLTIPVDQSYQMSQMIYSHKQCLSRVLDKGVALNPDIFEDRK